MLYLATPSTSDIREAMRAGLLGQLLSHDSGHKIHAGTYAVDNCRYAAWSAGRPWDAARWLDHLASHLTPACLWAVVPDVVGDASATRVEWDHWAPQVAALGARRAYVTQNGQTTANMPWDELDAVFTGGDDDWKESPAARALIVEARDRGKATHCGRVNTLARLTMAARDGYDTVDGTFLAFGPDVNLPRLLRYIRTALNRVDQAALL